MSGSGLGRWGLGLVLSLHLLGCQSDRVDVASPKSEGTVSSRTVTTDTAQVFTVVIGPATPTAETDLVAVSNEAAVSYRWMKNAQVLDGEVGRTLPKGRFVKGDRVSVVATLGVRSIEATTRIHNSPPRAISVKLDPPAAVYRGVDLRAVPVGVDADGDEIRWSYEWVINQATSPSNTTSILPGDRYRRGEVVTVRVIPSDAEAEGAPYIPLPITIPNAPPVFTSAPLAAFTSEMYRYEAHADDADGDTVRYRLVGAPAGMTIDPVGGHIVWPLTDQPNGRHTAEIVAEDDAGGQASQRLDISVDRKIAQEEPDA